jgi:hypothetical protein
VFKITPLRLEGSQVPGSRISFSLLKDSACPTLDSFLASRDYALFSSSNKCCPLNELPRV